ncbi:hypothetical protein [Lactiplantibacillus herbarum]|uniref:hypothetical protein n=1 Tax=Lactiplantibacillus herbarum TaxID=1670446 RepID=UPI00064EB6C6|nr:hypothetical protein [Lactiplantibacillus herbarum]
MKKINMLILGSVILPSLLLTACTNHTQQTANSKTSASIAKKTAKEVASTKPSTAAASSTSNTDTDSTSQSSTVQAESTDSDDHLQLVQDYLLGKSFTIFPTQYDGEDVGKAMDEQKAPQSTVHDGGTYLYFEEASRVHETGSMMSDNAWYENYTITDDAVQIGSKVTIPYVINDNTVNFQDWTTTTDDGHTLTWRLNLDDSAKGIITSKANQDWHPSN